MTQEDKELLLKDLCARSPYGVICAVNSHNERLDSIDPFEEIATFGFQSFDVSEVKPYLRPMSSMTEEEHDELFGTQHNTEMEEIKNSGDYLKASIIGDMAKYDWLNSHHFDYRGLIDKGIAIEAPEGMYKL